MRIAGEDRLTFLQGQLTQDVAALGMSGTLLAAWCTPKGRVLVSGRLLALADAVGFVIPSASADAIRQRLLMYRIRARVEIDIDRTVCSRAIRAADLPAAFAQPDPAPGSAIISDGVTIVRLTDSVLELHGPQAAADAEAFGSPVPETDWRIARIEAGLVDIDQDNAERYTPHMLNMDRSGAVSFHKGCYTGQEVVARTENLGRVKRRVNRYRLAEGTAAVGDRLTAGDDTVGEVVNAAGDQLLAIVPVDRHAEVLLLDGVTASPLPLPYSLD